VRYGPTGLSVDQKVGLYMGGSTVAIAKVVFAGGTGNIMTWGANKLGKGMVLIELKEVRVKASKPPMRYVAQHQGDASWSDTFTICDILANIVPPQMAVKSSSLQLCRRHVPTPTWLRPLVQSPRKQL
jgi:hypothetical protein